MAQYGTIVVVDDNPAILTALRICLDSTFERVITLASPDSLPATLQQEKASIVLMDMNFTLGMNTGHEGLTWLRTLRHLHPQLPGVLISAYADVQRAVKCLKAGASDFVTKPWDNDELLRTLKDAVDLVHVTFCCLNQGNTVLRVLNSLIDTTNLISHLLTDGKTCCIVCCSVNLVYGRQLLS